jgi:hypothetical protein
VSRWVGMRVSFLKSSNKYMIMKEDPFWVSKIEDTCLR